jgi:aspartyl/glutamyl-tRNA(Asn/Gln) amidotransferase C subunit
MASGLTRSDIDAAARLARLHLDDDEADRLLADLNGILSFMAVIDDADAAAADLADDAATPLRADAATQSSAGGPALAAAPETVGGCFAVPNLFRP